jgi:hypothetical protein
VEMGCIEEFIVSSGVTGAVSKPLCVERDLTLWRLSNLSVVR